MVSTEEIDIRMARLAGQGLDHRTLALEADRYLQRVVGYNMASWSTVDPATMLPTSCTLTGGAEVDHRRELRMFQMEWAGGGYATSPLDLAVWARALFAGRLHDADAGHLAQAIHCPRGCGFDEGDSDVVLLRVAELNRNHVVDTVAVEAADDDDATGKGDPNHREQRLNGPAADVAHPAHRTRAQDHAVFDVTAPHVLAGADFLVNITNDAWFGDSAAPYQHLSMAILRAVENGVYLVRAANTGISALVEPTGRVLERSDLFVEAVLSGTFTPGSARTFYTRYGDVFAWVCGLISVLLLATRGRRGRGEGGKP